MEVNVAEVGQTVKRMPPPTEAQILAVKKAAQQYVAAVRHDHFCRPRPLTVEERMRVLDSNVAEGVR